MVVICANRFYDVGSDTADVVLPRQGSPHSSRGLRPGFLLISGMYGIFMGLSEPPATDTHRLRRNIATVHAAHRMTGRPGDVCTPAVPRFHRHCGPPSVDDRLKKRKQGHRPQAFRFTTHLTMTGWSLGIRRGTGLFAVLHALYENIKHPLPHMSGRWAIHFV